MTLANRREQNAARNISVIRTLRRYRLAEDAGMGVDVMEDAMQAALLEPPEFGADSAHVEVVFRLGSTVTPQERAWIAAVEQRGDLRSGDRILLLHAARGELLTNASAREVLGVDSVHARTALQRLRDLSYLGQRGQRGGVSYTLASGLGPPAGLRLDEEALREIVLTLAARGSVTNETIRSRTGLDRARVLTLLTAMVDSGDLERHGERRGAHYRRQIARARSRSHREQSRARLRSAPSELGVQQCHQRCDAALARRGGRKASRTTAGRGYSQVPAGGSAHRPDVRNRCSGSSSFHDP